jgi:hypothetical protein
MKSNPENTGITEKMNVGCNELFPTVHSVVPVLSSFP